MFELSKTNAKLVSINARAECHGEDRKPAFDLKFEATLPSDILIEFHPQLRKLLFTRSDDPDLVEQTDPEAMSALRFREMGPIKWNWEAAGYRLTVHYGIGDATNIVMEGVEVDHFSFMPQNGGSVLVAWRAICHPKSGDVGRLCEFIQQKVDITLESPEEMATDSAKEIIDKVRK